MEYSNSAVASPPCIRPSGIGHITDAYLATVLHTFAKVSRYARNFGYTQNNYSIIMDKIELTVKDSVHIACAAEGKAIFITVDDEIVKKRKTIAKLGVRVVNPVEFVEGF